MPRLQLVLLRALVALALGLSPLPLGAEPLFTLEDGGQTFLYRARPGDHPTAVAQMFGIPPEDIARFLADNRISDPTRVGAGFVYRVPNAAARALAERNAALEAEKARLARVAGETAAHVRALTRETRQAREGAALAEKHAARMARLEALWPAAQAALVLLGIIAAGASTVALASVRRQRQAARYARALAIELEEKRRANMAERQESARRILDLEARARALESRLGPRVVIGGRNS
jgi:hypothetical protein